MFLSFLIQSTAKLCNAARIKPRNKICGHKKNAASMISASGVFYRF
jgi:hypothetical protein